MSNRIRRIIIGLGLILLVLAGYPQYPWLVLYYYVLSLFSLYKYSLPIRLSIWVLYIMFCISPLILRTRRTLGLRKTKTDSNRLLTGIPRRRLVYFLAIFLVILSLEASLVLALLSPVERDMSVFTTSIQSACNSNVTCTAERITRYIDSKLGWSWNNPMSALEIDNMLSPTDYRFLDMLGFTQAHVVLWQGWGSCGQHATVTAYLLHRLGYSVRVAHFNDIDHAWAEVYVNGSWYIVDPWYIGGVYKKQYQGNKHLVPIDTLATLKDFSGNHKVLCGYLNGTEMDCTSEHGYIAG